MEGGFARGQLIGYATVAALAVIPSVLLMSAGFSPANGTYPFVTFALALMVALLLLRPLQLVAQLHEAPLRQLAVDLKTQWPWLATATLMAVALPQTLDASTALKRHIPDFNRYYADAALMRLDGLFGVEPWQVTHAILGPFGTRVIDTLYGLWHAVQIALATWLILSRDRRFQLRGAIAFQATWLLLGGLLAIAFASVGPCFVKDFYGSDHYAPLMARLPADLHSVTAMNYLRATEGGNAIGGGISAMPSLHVAIVVLVGLCVRDRFPRWQWLAWSYAAVIYIGSIHLAWHYASDGIVGAVGVVAIWKAAGWYVERLESSPGALAAQVGA